MFSGSLESWKEVPGPHPGALFPKEGAKQTHPRTEPVQNVRASSPQFCNVLYTVFDFYTE